MRLVFMGSPFLAVPILRGLVAAGHETSLIVTQVARRAGRGLRETQPPVAVEAATLGLPVYQPTTLRSEKAQERIRDARPDVIVVAAYGRILPPSVLAIPPLSCLNVHLSLLPHHRGASPVSGALLAGDGVTGVSVMLMDEGLDSGPVLAQVETPIGGEDDQISLTARLASFGADLIVDTLPRWASGSINPIPQHEASVTWTRPTTRADGQLDWNEPAVHLWRRVRAYADWPQAHTVWAGKLLRILKADWDPILQAPAGAVKALGAGRSPRVVAIGTGDGVLLPLVVGLEGRRAMPISAFLQGYKAFVEARLGSPQGGV